MCYLQMKASIKEAFLEVVLLPPLIKKKVKNENARCARGVHPEAHGAPSMASQPHASLCTAGTCCCRCRLHHIHQRGLGMADLEERRLDPPCCHPAALSPRPPPSPETVGDGESGGVEAGSTTTRRSAMDSLRICIVELPSPPRAVTCRHATFGSQDPAAPHLSAYAHRYTDEL